MIFSISKSQWTYYRFWLITLLAVEGAMMVFNQHLFQLYLIIAMLFLAGLLLRIFHCYPGQSEPLILDFSAVLLSLLYALISREIGDSQWRYVLILTSSIIILPHFVFIFREK